MSDKYYLFIGFTLVGAGFSFHYWSLIGVCMGAGVGMLAACSYPDD
jgi:hypothetical protein